MSSSGQILRLLAVVLLVTKGNALSEANGHFECWGDSHLQDKNIPVEIIRKLNSAKNVQDFLQICNAQSRFSWQRITSLRYLLWQIQANTRELRDIKHRLRRDVPGSNYSSGYTEVGSMTLSRSHCQPRPVPVKVPQPKRPNALFYPTCIDVPRCVGCCGHSSLRCKPGATQRISKKVFSLELNSETGRINLVGFRTIRLTEHTSCDCQCKTRPGSCSPQQVFDKTRCKCTCPLEGEQPIECNSLQSWNQWECSCVCHNLQVCSTGQLYDWKLCRCVSENSTDASSLENNTTLIDSDED